MTPYDHAKVTSFLARVSWWHVIPLLMAIAGETLLPSFVLNLLEHFETLSPWERVVVMYELRERAEKQIASLCHETTKEARAADDAEERADAAVALADRVF